MFSIQTHMYVIFISGNFYFSFVSTFLAYNTITKNKRKAKLTWDKKLTITYIHRSFCEARSNAKLHMLPRLSQSPSLPKTLKISSARCARPVGKSTFYLMVTSKICFCLSLAFGSSQAIAHFRSRAYHQLN